MANWVGFSDEELRRLKQQTNPSTRDGRTQVNARGGRGRPPANRGRSAPRERPTQIQRASPGLQGKYAEASEDLPQQARLSQPTPPPPEPQPQKLPNLQGSALAQQSPQSPQTEKSPKVQGAENGVCSEGKDSEEKIDDNMGMVLDERDIIKQELHNVEKFQFQQKRIEEQNKKKRELLTTAIFERQKKAKQEATRLTRIQKELAQLDHLLAIDVSIIRNKIEESSREYLEAQRRYERAEKEFIESKTDLHQKCELKDSMTEHLHMIIHENEVRKARKLTELMEKLSMEEGSDSEGLANVEELSKSSPSAYILGSLQSTAEQRMMMRRMRSTSETEASSDAPKSPPGSNVKRSASDSGPDTPGGADKGPGGVTGWISSWLMGSPTEEGKSKGDSDSNGDSTFKPANSDNSEGAKTVVTKAPVGGSAPETGQASTEKGQALPGTPQVIPETGQASTQKGQALPETPKVIPETDQASTEKSQVLPQTSPVIPEIDQASTQKKQVLPETSQVIAEKTQTSTGETSQASSTIVATAQGTVQQVQTPNHSTDNVENNPPADKGGETNSGKTAPAGESKSLNTQSNNSQDESNTSKGKPITSDETGPSPQPDVSVVPKDLNDNKVREQEITASPATQS